jgi:hypothetical protein
MKKPTTDQEIEEFWGKIIIDKTLANYFET